MQPQPIYGYVMQPNDGYLYQAAPRQYHVEPLPQGIHVPPVPVAGVAPASCSAPHHDRGAARQLPARVLEGRQGSHDEWCGYLDGALTLIDKQHPSADETDSLFLHPWPCLPQDARLDEPYVVKQQQPANTNRSQPPAKEKTPRRHAPQRFPTLPTAAVSSYFSKVDLYANSKLPLELPPLVVDVEAWPLICLASQYSQQVYSPNAAHRHALVPSDWRSGTKTMYVESVPADDARTVVVAIRGTASFADWAVNLRAEPAAPERFLDDFGNACHAGFLDVARTMVAPVADRLRRILEDDPARTAHSLVLTGHSAGGAVASLVYMHMLAREASCQSELNALTACFSSIHCITFGAPPVSLLPLQKPKRPELSSSLFLSLVNQGDPVVRAGKAYIKSLVDLLRSPSPCSANSSTAPQSASVAASRRWLQKSWTKNSKLASGPLYLGSTAPIWVVPPCTLSNGGLIVVLRSYHVGAPSCRGVKQMMDQGVVAVTSCDEQLRSVIWGDPMQHHMKLYAARVEALAVEAVVREMD